MQSDSVTEDDGRGQGEMETHDPGAAERKWIHDILEDVHKKHNSSCIRFPLKNHVLTGCLLPYLTKHTAMFLCQTWIAAFVEHQACSLFTLLLSSLSVLFFFKQ